VRTSVKSFVKKYQVISAAISSWCVCCRCTLYMCAFTSVLDFNLLLLLAVVRADFNCLLTADSSPKPLPRLLPGQMFNPDVQCHIMLGEGAFYCGVSLSIIALTANWLKGSAPWWVEICYFRMLSAMAAAQPVTRTAVLNCLSSSSSSSLYFFIFL